jgi:hypothetical protein
MTLVEAFRIVGPIEKGHRDYASRQAAGRRLITTLVELASERFPTDLAHELAGNVLEALIRNGPRGDGPESDELVVHYLQRSLTHARTSRKRARQRERTRTAPITDVLGNDVVAGPDRTDEEAERRRLRGLLEHARRRLFEEIVPELVRRKPGRFAAGFLETVENLRRIAAGELTVGEVVEARIAAEGGSGDRKKARNAIDQAHARALREIRQAIVDRMADPDHPTPEEHALLQEHECLRPRS